MRTKGCMLHFAPVNLSGSCGYGGGVPKEAVTYSGATKFCSCFCFCYCVCICMCNIMCECTCVYMYRPLAGPGFGQCLLVQLACSPCFPSVGITSSHYTFPMDSGNLNSPWESELPPCSHVPQLLYVLSHLLRPQSPHFCILLCCWSLLQ